MRELEELKALVSKQINAKRLWIIPTTKLGRGLQRELKKIHESVGAVIKNIDQLDLFEPNKEVSNGTKS